eukprot:TRINITY_DN245_c0_g1_i18.p1 TRINITY_DN245_c0_g1~~TRINITY_DN245_c0_g1_i18.p1  ORF type:complete len:214 (+),score=48.47 TRINITY_DN245_c0_g1_i18:335-976(+)
MSELRDDIARFVRQVRLEVEQQEEREEEQMDECETDSESFSFQDLQPRQTHQELLRLIYKVEKEDHMWLQSLDDGCVCFQGAQCQCSPVQDCEEELEGGDCVSQLPYLCMGGGAGGRRGGGAGGRRGGGAGGRRGGAWSAERRSGFRLQLMFQFVLSVSRRSVGVSSQRMVRRRGPGIHLQMTSWTTRMNSLWRLRRVSFTTLPIQLVDFVAK